MLILICVINTRKQRKILMLNMDKMHKLQKGCVKIFNSFDLVTES
jgi:hypothetical protein